MLSLIGDIVCITYLVCLVPLVIFFDAICLFAQDVFLTSLQKLTEKVD